MSDQNNEHVAKAQPAKRSLIARLARERPTRPGETYGVPGSGDTMVLSLATIAILLFVWWVITTMGWVKPLFVPSPQSIVVKFISVWQEGFTGSPLWVHILISAGRVFGDSCSRRLRRGHDFQGPRCSCHP